MANTLANALLRVAQTQTSPRQYLLDLITSKVSSITTLNGQITSTTVNGKSSTIQAVRGASITEVMESAQLALSCLESGLTYVPSQTYAVVR
jgi:predicted GTPase